MTVIKLTETFFDKLSLFHYYFIKAKFKKIDWYWKHFHM